MPYAVRGPTVNPRLFADTLHSMALTWADYLVIGGYLAAITAFGSWFARFQRTTRDYFLTDRSVPWWAICFTIVATETSTLTFIGIPAASYTGNMTFLQLAAGYVIGRLLVSALFIPAYFRGDLFTSYELLQRRFGTSVKALSASIFLLTRSLADGIRLFATALVIAVVTQLPVSGVIVVLGAAMILYTVRGGVSAVIWTDVVQMFVYAAGAAAVALALLARIPGGWAEVVEVGWAAGKFAVLDVSLDVTRPYTLWAGVLGGIALTLATHGTDQFLVQRLLAARSQRDAVTGLVLSGVLVFAQFIVFLLIGIMLYAYYLHVPLPRPLSRPDEILPIFVVSSLTNGLAGFIVAAIVAAALSPSLNAMAATTLQDFYLRYMNPLADQPLQMRVSRSATVVWGIVQVAVALGAQLMDRSVLDAGLSVLSFASGSVLGAFLLGTLTSAVRERNVLVGMVAGLLVMTGVWIGTSVAFTWYVFIGAVTTCAVAWTGARLAPAPSTVSVDLR
ncbi:MAG: sodium:solute symporter [Vicinamibacterales bacterium]